MSPRGGPRKGAGRPEKRCPCGAPLGSPEELQANLCSFCQDMHEQNWASAAAWLKDLEGR